MNLNGKVTNPGEMRTLVILASRTVTSGTGGFPVPGYSLIGQVWAKWINVHGSEAWAAATAEALQPATVTIRYRSDVAPTCVVIKGGSLVDVVDEHGVVTGHTISGGSVYEIVSLDNIQERGEYLEIKVKRTVSG
jgi:head-tail adaptor